MSSVFTGSYDGEMKEIRFVVDSVLSRGSRGDSADSELENEPKG